MNITSCPRYYSDGTLRNRKIHCQSYDISQKVVNYGYNKMAVLYRKNSDAGIFGIGQEMMLPQFCVNEDDGFYWYVDTNFETTAFLGLTVLILALYMCVNCKTWHPYKIDFYKSINYYILGTIGFGVFLQLGGGLGFTRPIGIGVLLHNTAEFFILKKLWFGKYGIASYVLAVGAVYQIVFLISLMWMPITFLYLFAMFQGGTMDFALVMTYGVAAFEHYKKYGKGKKKEEKKDTDCWCCPWNSQAWILGCTAATIHIATIIPMFFGLQLGRLPLAFSATAGLAVTFLFYELYLAFRYGRLICCDKSYSSEIELTLNIASSQDMDFKLMVLDDLNNTGSTGESICDDLERICNDVKEKQKNKGEKNKEYEEKKENKENKENNDKEANNDIKLNNNNDSNNKKKQACRNNLFENIEPDNITQENDLSAQGLLIYFFMFPKEEKINMCLCCAKDEVEKNENYDKKKRGVFCFYLTCIVGACCSLGVSLFVWFSPVIWKGRCRA